MGGSLRVGVTLFNTDQGIATAELARLAEERDFDSVYVPEHTHIPTSRRTPHPLGIELTEEYKRTLDPFVSLAAAAAVTGRIRLGTAVSLIACRDPILLAKEVATLDFISGGRVVLGIGYGWNREEMADHGVDFARRRARTREHMLAMQRLWTQERASFAGEFVRFDDCWSWPKPIQQPRPPVLIGGTAGARLFEHIAEYGDGWAPVGGAGVAEALPRLRDAVAAAGRDPAQLRIVAVGTIPTAAKLEYYAAVGFTEVVFRLPDGGRDAVLPVLDEYAELVRKIGRRKAS